LTLQTIDWLILAAFFAAILAIGLCAGRKAGSDATQFFLGGRSMPWWLLGVSMVACTFSCDTPNLVTGMVRQGGVAANWGWWAFLITGMVTVFVYAQLWRRSAVMTDLEFYELRYSGKSAAFIRGFRALYLGLFFNCLIMGAVTLAAVKIGQVIFDLEPLPSVVFGSACVVLYATVGGIRSCLWADFFQYSIALLGAIYAAIVAVGQPEVGGLAALLAHPRVAGGLALLPDFSTWLAWVPLLLIPVAVQWGAVWYPGAEPGGGGYIAQRMLAARDEKNAIGATLLFNFMHYAVRPWPWILVALASLVCYPTLESIRAAFPGIDPAYLKPDIAYPVMIARIGPGFLGLVVASLVAAYMSTIGTHLNWGASYAVNDFYKRFLRPRAGDRELVLAGRIFTVALMAAAGAFALTFLQDAYQAFQILLLSGAGTGAIYLLRWFWWRINAWSEIAAMAAATAAAFWLVLGLGESGTLALALRAGAVPDRVLVIDDPAAAARVEAERLGLDAAIAREERELERRIGEWRHGRREGNAARDAARGQVDASQERIERLRAQAAPPALLEAQGETPWRAALAAFRARHPGPPGGLIAAGRIYLYAPEVAGLTFPIQLLVCVALVTAAWLLATFLTPAVEKTTLRRFYRRCHPGGPGWRRVLLEAAAEGEELDPANASGEWRLPVQILCVFLGCVAVYAALFAAGSLLYGNLAWGLALAGLALGATLLLFRNFGRTGAEPGA